jgi:hypothetical protein
MSARIDNETEPSAPRKHAWKFMCFHDARHFWATSTCTLTERDEWRAQLGDTCALCGAPIVVSEQPAPDHR